MYTESRRALDAWFETADAVLADPPIISNPYEDAADLLERCGWRQGCYGNSTVGFCLLGALLHVSGERLGRTKTKWAFRTARGWAEALGVSKAGRSGVRSIVEWNDEPGRSLDEVLERLRLAGKAGR